MKRFAFVVPRYFRGIAGGAETLLGTLGTRLAARGDLVEILTTCAQDNRTWENEFAPGVEEIDGVRVRRFAVEPRDLDTWIPIQLAIHGGERVSVERQLSWMEESVNSQELYRVIAADRANDGAPFDAFFFGPYLFGTTFWGSLIHPSKSILVPCLHDESYAYQDVIASMFRQVRGCLFNAGPEMDLARSIYGRIPGGGVGMGFDVPDQRDVDAIAPYFDNSEPYILYLGRKETGKNVHLLIDFFCDAKDRGAIPNELKLVILGGGSFDDLHRPRVLDRGDVIDLPHGTEHEKQQLLRHAVFLCQPSTNESFSIVIMEAWMVGTPVVVHSGCAVTKEHVVESGGGLYLASLDDFIGVTNRLVGDPTLRSSLAADGRSYVIREYAWEAVISRFDRVVGELLGSGTGRAAVESQEVRD